MTGANPFGGSSGVPASGGGREPGWSPFGPATDDAGQAYGPGGAVGSMEPARAPGGYHTGFGSGFDEQPIQAPLQAGTPPLMWLGLALLAAAGGLGIALLVPPPAVGAFPSAAFLGWLLAGPVAIGLLAVFLSKDAGLRARSFYAAPRWLPWAYRGVLLVAVVGVVLSALRLADWAGRL